MDLKVIRFGKACRWGLGWEQQCFQPDLIHIFWQRPGHVMSLGQADVLAHHTFGETAGAGNTLMAQTCFVLEAQDLDNLSHGNPRSRHPLFLVMKRKGYAG